MSKEELSFKELPDGSKIITIKGINQFGEKYIRQERIKCPSVWDALKRLTYTADDMEAFAEFVGKFSTRKRTITYDTVSNKWFIKELKEGTLNTTFYTTAQLHELWEKERKEEQK